MNFVANRAHNSSVSARRQQARSAGSRGNRGKLDVYFKETTSVTVRQWWFFQGTPNPVKARCSGAVFAPPWWVLIAAPPGEDHVGQGVDTSFETDVSSKKVTVDQYRSVRLIPGPHDWGPVERA